MYKALLFSISTVLFCVGLPSVVDASSSTLTVAGCKQRTEAVSSDRIAIVRQFIQAVEAQDIQTINQLLADNVVLEQPYSQLQPGGVRVEGKQAANVFFDRIFRQYSQIRFVDVVLRQSQFDNAVILEGQGDFRVAANQSPYRNRYIGVIEVVDGRIALIREYFNPLIVPDTSSRSFQ